jgi:hypothetical protein
MSFGSAHTTMAAWRNVPIKRMCLSVTEIEILIVFKQQVELVCEIHRSDVHTIITASTAGVLAFRWEFCVSRNHPTLRQ